MGNVSGKLSHILSLSLQSFSLSKMPTEPFWFAGRALWQMYVIKDKRPKITDTVHENRLFCGWNASKIKSIHKDGPFYGWIARSLVLGQVLALALVMVQVLVLALALILMRDLARVLVRTRVRALPTRTLINGP